MLKKKEIFEVLDFWNYWNKDLKIINSRKDYEYKVKKFRKANEIIAIKGIRRCGKSTLLKLEISNLLKEKVDKKTDFICEF